MSRFKNTITALQKRTRGMSVPGPTLSEEERRSACAAYGALIEGQRGGASIVTSDELSRVPEHLRIVEGMSARDAAERYRLLLDWYPTQ